MSEKNKGADDRTSYQFTKDQKVWRVSHLPLSLLNSLDQTETPVFTIFHSLDAVYPDYV